MSSLWLLRIVFEDISAVALQPFPPCRVMTLIGCVCTLHGKKGPRATRGTCHLCDIGRFAIHLNSFIHKKGMKLIASTLGVM